MVQTLIRQDITPDQDLSDSLIQALKQLPELAQEPIVDTNFIATAFFF